MKITIELTGTGNAAVEAYNAEELAAWALQQAAKRVIDGYITETHRIKDINGNTVGTMTITDVDPAINVSADKWADAQLQRRAQGERS